MKIASQNADQIKGMVTPMMTANITATASSRVGSSGLAFRKKKGSCQIKSRQAAQTDSCVLGEADLAS